LDSVDCQPTHAIYTFIPGHVSRAAGLKPWSKGTPRYTLEGATIKRDGALKRPRRFKLPRGKLRKLGKKSALYRALSEYEAKPRPEDYDRAAAIIRESVTRLTTRYPGINFMMINFDKSIGNFTDGEKRMFSSLKADGIDLRSVHEIIPGIKKETHGLSVYDGHPNALAHRLVAEYILREVVKVEPVE